MKDLILQMLQLGKNFFNETIIFFSFIFGFILDQIGYPKEIVIVIVVLSIADVLSKWYSVTVINSGRFNLTNLYITWLKDRKLTSEKFRVGITAKVFFYGILLYVAHRLVFCSEIIGGEFISAVIYTSLFLTEVISILENMTICGFYSFEPFLNFFRKKQNEVLEVDDDDDK